MRLNEANPQVVINGIGVMSLSQAVKRVNDMLEDLHRRAQGPVTAENWNQIKALVDKQLVQTYIDSIAKALRELQ